MNLQVPQNAENVAFLPGRAKDLSAPLYCQLTDAYQIFVTRRQPVSNVISVGL